MTALLPHQSRLMMVMLLLPFLLLFIGDIPVPLGESVITVPLCLFVLVPLFMLLLLEARLRASRLTNYLMLILVFGLLGTLLTPEAKIARAAAGALPLAYAVIVLLVYGATTPPAPTRIVNGMLCGGVVLAVWVIALGVSSVLSDGDFYERKLLVETLLGRSNYLAAFLVFLVGLCWARHRVLAPLFIFAVMSTMSRGGLLMLVLFLLAAWLARRGRLWFIGLLSVLAFFALVAFVFLYQVEAFDAYLDPSDILLASAKNRLLLWSFGWELLASHPLVGIGPNTFRTFVEASEGVEDVWSVHNSIFLMLLNYGAFGFVAYALYLREIYRAMIMAEVVDPSVAYLRAAFLVLLVFSLFEPLVGSATFELLLVLIYVYARSLLRPGSEKRSPARRRNVPTLV